MIKGWSAEFGQMYDDLFSFILKSSSHQPFKYIIILLSFLVEFFVNKIRTGDGDGLVVLS